MRIAIAKKLLSTVGGSEVYARRLAQALSDRGHEVALVGMRPPWARPGIPAAAVGPGSTFEEGGPVRVAYVPSLGGIAGALADALLPVDLADPRALESALGGAEIVHCVAREWAAPLERIARRRGAAFVETPLAHPGQPFSGAAARDVARYRSDGAVIALTEWEAGFYRGRGAPRVFVTGTGPSIAPADAASDGATVLFVGRKERYKGYHALRAAAELVWRERPDVRFVAIGQRAFGDLSRPPRDPRWIERGVVGEREKAEAYARASVLAMPSQHETFGQTYLEAWAAGKPVVAGDIPPLREVVREGVDGLHARNEPRDLARALLRILADASLAERMGAAGRARLDERWTWPKIAEATERAYRSARVR